MYKRQDLKDGQVLTEQNLRILEDGINANDIRIECLNHYGDVDIEPTNSDYFNYSIYNGHIIIDSLKDSASVLTDVVIPYSIDDMLVKDINMKAFKGNKNIKSIIVPRSVNTIGGEVFMNCTNLDTVIALGNVSYIGTDVFTGCSENLVITCHQGSYMDEYAKASGIKCGYADIANEPSDWEQEDDTKINYIKNKPPIKRGSDGSTIIDGDVRVTGDITVGDNEKLVTNTEAEGIREQIDTLESDVEGIRKQVNEHAHFRGYKATDEQIQEIEATPNDFAYSAESGTKWVYDEVNGWVDTGTPVPDQLTPASGTTPLMNGEASTGEEEAYARGDHRHPTDTTRASATELNELKDRITPIEKGGTGANNAVDATENLKILLPQTKAILGLPETATPDDAFNGLFNKIATENMENLVIQPIGTSQTWSAPKAVGQLFKVFCVGGGGGGGGFDNNNVTTHAGGGGGGGGHIEIATLKIEQGTVIDIVCGAGGAGGAGATSPSDGGTGGDTFFGELLTAAGGEGGGACSQRSYHDGYGGKGGNGGAGGGGGAGGAMGVSYPSVGGDGGNGSLCGGGGAGCTQQSNDTKPTVANGGTGGIYGGHGGTASGRSRAPKLFGGRIADILFQLDRLTKGLLHMQSAEMSDSVKGYGEGGVGGAGGVSTTDSTTKLGTYQSSCGGGGGYCGDGGGGYRVGGGGGGGGYCGDGGGGYYGGGGGGGFFCNGGNGGTAGGGGGGFFCNGDVGNTAGTGNGGTGGVLIMYIEEA